MEGYSRPTRSLTPSTPEATCSQKAVESYPTSLCWPQPIMYAEANGIPTSASSESPRYQANSRPAGNSVVISAGKFRRGSRRQ